jgi:sec-independent protein translocase protein TatA
MGEGLFQPMHLLLILVIALLLFGPKRLPEIGKGIGDGIRALKEGMKDQNAKADTKTEDKTDPKPESKA